jgi:hypothetical protein
MKEYEIFSIYAMVDLINLNKINDPQKIIVLAPPQLCDLKRYYVKLA